MPIETPGHIPDDLEEKLHQSRVAMIDKIRSGFEGSHLSERVLHAVEQSHRHQFIPAIALLRLAYENMPLGIKEGSTISDPELVAIMTDMLDVHEDHTVLEIGTGTGWQASILGRLAKEVYTVEIDKELADFARDNIERMGLDNVHVIHGNGYDGYQPAAPYDRILFTASLRDIPQEVIDQLKEGGKIIVPVQHEQDEGKQIGGSQLQRLTVGTKKDGELEIHVPRIVAFIPMRDSE